MQIKTHHRDQIIPFLPTIHKWVAAHSSNPPWNYLPPKSELISPRHTIFANDPNGMLVTAEKGNELLGMMLGIPMDSPFLRTHSFPKDTLKTWESKGYDLSHLYYAEIFLLSSQVRNDKKLIQEMYETFTSYAKKIGKNRIVYMDIISDHPSTSPFNDPSYGFKSTGIAIDLSVPRKNDSTIPMLFYINQLA